MPMHNYDPKDFSISVGGYLIDDGFGEDSMISFELDDPEIFKVVAGVDGEATRIRNRKTSGKCTITLMGTSRHNDVLSALLLADMAAPNGAGVVSMQVKDRFGGLKISTVDAFISGPPTVDVGSGPGEREWVISFGSCSFFVGGK